MLTLAIGFGFMGLRLGRLGSQRGNVVPPEPGATGSPMGLLLVLTYS